MVEESTPPTENSPLAISDDVDTATETVSTALDAGDGPTAILTPEQARVLGCLIEKSRTTPDDYPLTGNALMRACNQSTSRDPVVSYDLRTIERVVGELKAMKLVRFVHMATGRAVTKYRHVADDAWSIDESEAALLALLMLRGPQTMPELKARAERILSFDSLQSVVEVLEQLAARPEGWVVRLERQIGQREDRWTHCFFGEPLLTGGSQRSSGSSSSAGSARSASNERIESLEALVGALAAQVQKLTVELAEVKRELGLSEAV